MRPMDSVFRTCFPRETAEALLPLGANVSRLATSDEPGPAGLSIEETCQIFGGFEHVDGR